jgi:hypothetical protein
MSIPYSILKSAEKFHQEHVADKCCVRKGIEERFSVSELFRNNIKTV